MARMTVIAACLSALMAGVSLSQAQEVKWNMSNEYPATSLAAQGDAEFAKRVGEATEGRVQITNLFGGASGMRSTDHFTAVEDGALALASTPTDKLLGIAPVFGLFSIPFIAPSVDHSKRLVASAREELEAAFADAGQLVLFTSPWTPSGIWANAEVKDVAGLQGLKIRTFDESSTQTMRAAGVTAVQLTWGDVFPALSSGMIDSVITSDETGVSAKIWEHTKVFNAAGFSVGVNVIHINKEAFEQLSAADQEAVKKAAAEVEAWAWDKGLERQKSNFATMRENNVTVVEAMPEPVMQHLQKAASPLRDKWIEAMGTDAAEAILSRYE